MTIVVDATAIVAIVTRSSVVDAHIATATRLLVPDLALAEVLNVRWKYRRAKLVAPALDSILSFFDRITLVPSRAYAGDADILSMELHHPVYDCLYAAVAHRESGRLITADQKFARKLKRRQIDVVVFGREP